MSRKTVEISPLCKALTDRWPITDERRQQIIDILMVEMKNPMNNGRAKSQIAKALLAADALNIQTQIANQDAENEARRQATLDMLRDPNKIIIAHRESVAIASITPTPPAPAQLPPAEDEEAL